MLSNTYIWDFLFSEKSPEKKIRANVYQVENVDNDLIKQHDFLNWFLEIHHIRIQTSIVEYEWQLWSWLWVFKSEVDGREDIKHIDTLTNTDEGKSEMGPEVNILNITSQAATDIQESDEAGTSSVH